MFHLDNNSGVSSMPAVSAMQDNSPRWFTEGAGNQSPSWPGQDWFNIVQAELLNVLSTAGVTPSKTQFSQLATAIKEIINKNALLRNNPLSEIKEDGAAAQTTARSHLGLKAAATSEVTTSDTDTTTGRLLKVGDYGLSLALKIAANTDLAVFFSTARGLVYRCDTTTYINGPSFAGKTWFDVYVSTHETAQYRTLLAISASGDIEAAAMSGSANSFSGWTAVYSTRKKPSASDVGALPLAGGKMLGDVTFKNGGLIFPEEAYKNKAFGRFGTYASDSVDYRWELYALSKANNNLRTNVITADIADISKGSESGGDRNNPTTTIALHGEVITPRKFTPGDYSNFDARYQAKGNYTPAGQAYTKAESDARYVTDVQLGAGTSKTTWNTSGNWPKTAGYVITSVWKDAQDPNLDGIVYAPMQKKIGSTWYTVSGGLA